MDDSDLNLTLNLNVSYKKNPTAIKQTQERVTGNRAERIKKRKQLKQDRKRAETNSTPVEDHAPDSNSKAVKRKRASSDGDGSPPAKLAKQDRKTVSKVPSNRKTEVISSLFRHNPDIPSVKSKTVKAVTEEVFTSTKFNQLPLFPHLVSTLEGKLGLTTMTRVQQKAIPTILDGKDVLVKSQTGSGKTLSYAVPIVHTLANLPRKIQRNHGPYAIVILPTRELAIQSHSTFQQLLQSCVWVVAGCLMGGENRQKEKSRIRKGINILLAPPGRLLDHLQRTSCLNLENVRWLVIDEADRMLDMGYEKDVAEIISILNERCSDKRQTLLLSATLTQGVERLAGMTLQNHISIDASDGSEQSESSSGQAQLKSTFSVPEKLKQQFVVVPCKLRLVTLAAFLLWRCRHQSKKSKVVVFLSTQSSVEFHHQLLGQVMNPQSLAEEDQDDDHLSAINRLGGGKGKDTECLVDDIRLFKLHGDMQQKERSRVFQDFTAASSGVLLCTDVASRGLHLPRVDWIVQYTTPGATIDYIHRVGRTARAGKQGNALLFLMPGEVGYLQELNNHNIAVNEVQMKDILSVLLTSIVDLPRPAGEHKRQWPRTYEEAATYMQDRFEERVLSQPSLQTLAAKGYQSFVRSYATYPSELKSVFSMKSLHLGHVAKSFALRKAPSHLHGVASAGKSQKKGQGSKGKNTRLTFESKKKLFGQREKRRPFSRSVSEFGSGLAGKKKDQW